MWGKKCFLQFPKAFSFKYPASKQQTACFGSLIGLGMLSVRDFLLGAWPGKNSGDKGVSQRSGFPVVWIFHNFIRQTRCEAEPKKQEHLYICTFTCSHVYGFMPSYKYTCRYCVSAYSYTRERVYTCPLEFQAGHPPIGIIRPIEAQLSAININPCSYISSLPLLCLSSPFLNHHYLLTIMNHDQQYWLALINHSQPSVATLQPSVSNTFNRFQPILDITMIRNGGIAGELIFGIVSRFLRAPQSSWAAG